VDPAERAGVLLKTAAGLRRRRDELTALIVREAKKTSADADAEVCEAIDYCEYYARAALPLFRRRRLGAFAGELNEQWHDPRGVAVIISPWNFPLAILCGMTSAALVTGNTAVVKPAEQTPALAAALCRALWSAGVPRDVLHLVPGRGETVGAALVRDPRVSLIAFTGSMAVGLDIVQAAGATAPGQEFVKRVICEMGGKNAIIVDESADLDEAVLGVRASAFGYAGQKCSACSRVVVLKSIHDAFVSRLVESSRALVVGEASDAATDVPPLIDAAAAAKVRQYIALGREEGTLALGDDSPRGELLIGPHIFTGIRPGHRLAREEIFGPVLSVIAADTFDDALSIANGVGYKLTGGVFSRTPSHLERARRAFSVGNLYLNRNITGALVGRQPFGGFGLSGIGSKAGGGDYLLQFVPPRVCTENTLRRGFAPQA
jgi:RHH-type proline utilization regulon transcriptional repressor/proline dehydrogenase/delta 1-pyrroline-5-carboxylate dehydrogenase